MSVLLVRMVDVPFVFGHGAELVDAVEVLHEVHDVAVAGDAQGADVVHEGGFVGLAEFGAEDAGRGVHGRRAAVRVLVCQLRSLVLALLAVMVAGAAAADVVVRACAVWPRK